MNDLISPLSWYAKEMATGTWTSELNLIVSTSKVHITLLLLVDLIIGLICHLLTFLPSDDALVLYDLLPRPSWEAVGFLLKNL